MKNFFFTLVFWVSIISCYSQETVKYSSDWNPVFENQHVKIFSKYFKCEIPQEGLYAEYIILKAENKTDQRIQLSWYNDTYFENGCTNCDHSKRDTKRSIILLPKEIKEGDCMPGLNTGLKIFSKWLKMENRILLNKLSLTEINTSFIN